MAQHNIGLAPHVYAEFKSLEATIAQNGSWKPTANRLIEYLLNLWKVLHQAFNEAQKTKDPKVVASIYERLVFEAMHYRPPVRSRGPYSRAKFASLEDRIIVAIELKQRLGIAEPSLELINQFINAGGTVDPIRRQVIQRELSETHRALEKDRRDQSAPSDVSDEAYEAAKKKYGLGLLKDEEPASSVSPSEAPPAPQSLTPDPPSGSGQPESPTPNS